MKLTTSLHLAKLFQLPGHMDIRVLRSKPVWQCFRIVSSSAFRSIYYTGEEDNGEKITKKEMDGTNIWTLYVG